MTTSPQRTKPMTDPNEGLREGDVIERAYEGRAVKNYSRTGQRYRCLAYPCPNITDWFYLPANSHLCPSCIEQRVATAIRQQLASLGQEKRG